jgi:antitoxin YefM
VYAVFGGACARIGAQFPEKGPEQLLQAAVTARGPHLARKTLLGSVGKQLCDVLVNDRLEGYGVHRGLLERDVASGRRECGQGRSFRAAVDTPFRASRRVVAGSGGSANLEVQKTRSRDRVARIIKNAIILYMRSYLPLAEVRDRLSPLVASVQATHERVVITKNGKPAAVLIAVDDLESLEETLDVLADEEAMQAIRAEQAGTETYDLAEVRDSLRGGGTAA